MGDPSRFIPLIAGFIALCIYLLTLRREVGPGDAAELTLAVYQLGVTHPPGYPVHTLLGRLLNFAVSDPALATNLLSAICTAGAVALLSAIVLRITPHAGATGPPSADTPPVLNGRQVAALLAPLAFAFTPSVWQASVTTEVYNVNICIVAAALLTALRWRERPSTKLLCLTGVLLGVSLGSSLANLLLLPGFAVLVIAPGATGGLPASMDPGATGGLSTSVGLDTSARVRRLATALLVGGVTASIVLSWSYIRCSVHPPLGTEWLPNTPGGFLRYLSGSQYTLLLSQPLAFYLYRPIEHAVHWCQSLFWLGTLLGLWGLWIQWRRDRVICTALLAMFAANLAYFTFHPWDDYTEMVTPAYFILAVWIAVGICELDSHRAKAIRYVGAVAAPLAVIIGLLALGMPEHLRQTRGRPITQRMLTSLEWFPPGAVVVARWSEFAPLHYFQKTLGLRPDVTIVERSDRPRHYPWGTVNDWRPFVFSVASRRPVLVDFSPGKLASPMGTGEFTPARGGWYRFTVARDVGS